ncbi:Zcf27p [Sporothrix eucalyptigena]|uniref:Zcf27p n=1 Tax=Sporothrix eucalyptigena TaxID=1812306 RepID=A0ABP0D3F5_9PEZI
MSSPEELQAEASGPHMTGSKRPAPRGTAFYPRKRAVTACQVCRARRTKCDNLKPTCSFCLKTGAVCIQSSTDLSSFDPASLKILERLDEVQGILKSLATHNGIDSFSTAASSCQSSGENAKKVIQTDPSQKRPVLSSILPERSEDVLAWPIFAGNSNDAPWGIATDSSTHAMYLQFSTPVTSVADATIMNTSSPTALATLLEDMPQLVSSLVENFFSYVHVKNPILDEATTSRLVSATIIEGIDWSLKSCLTLLVCALGSIAGPFVSEDGTTSGSTAYANAQALFHAAERRLGACIGSGDLMAIQCLFLAGVYMMCVLQPRKAWRFFNTALAACQEFPFLRQSHPDDLSGNQDDYENTALDGCQESAGEDRESVLQQALYWSAWKSERELRGELRLPDFNLADRDRGLYPAFFPTPPPPPRPPQQVTEAPIAWSNSHEKLESPAWYFYLAEISLRRLCSNICAELLSLRLAHGEDSAFLAATALAVPTWEMQAQCWIDSLPPMLSLDAPSDFENDICRFVLRGHVINLYELIYWPFTVAATTGLDMSLRNSNTHPQIVSGAKPATEQEAADSTFILQLARKGLETHTRRIIVNEPGFRHRHHGTWYMIRNCTRSALVLVASALCMARRDCLVEGGPNDEFLAMPDGWRNSVASTTRLLAYWEPEAPDLRKGRRILEFGLERVMDQQMG